MSIRCRPILVVLSVLTALSASACGPASGGRLKIYTSLPLQTRQGESIRKGIELALKQAGWQAGGLQIEGENRTGNPAAGQSMDRTAGSRGSGTPIVSRRTRMRLSPTLT